MAKSPDEMAQSMINNLQEKTGRNLDEWLKITSTAKIPKHGQLVKFLKSEHGITHGFANLIAHKTLKSDAQSVGTDNELVDAQYSGEKKNLRPIYDHIAKIVEGFGDDVVVSPKKNYVSLRRKKQFAIVQPSTKSRVDVGINIKGYDITDRLELSGSFNAMVSHRVRLSSEKEVDAELESWLKLAYEKA